MKTDSLKLLMDFISSLAQLTHSLDLKVTALEKTLEKQSPLAYSDYQEFLHSLEKKESFERTSLALDKILQTLLQDQS